MKLKPSINAVNIIKKFEGFYPNAYLDPVGIPTIGYGTIRWMDGQRVKLGQVITRELAEKMILFELAERHDYIPENINQNQADALYSFIYNVGPGAFQKSTLRKILLKDANNPMIRAEFDKWVFGTKNGQKIKLPGLVKRRKAEADLYFKPL
jgi:lysozyme